jgi:hypothetical protein
MGPSGGDYPCITGIGVFPEGVDTEDAARSAHHHALGIPGT